jgi:hypothetical protein
MEKWKRYKRGFFYNSIWGWRMEKKVKIKISGEPVEKADIKIVRGYVVMPDQFDEVFENSSEIYKFFTLT